MDDNNLNDLPDSSDSYNEQQQTDRVDRSREEIDKSKIRTKKPEKNKWIIFGILLTGLLIFLASTPVVGRLLNSLNNSAQNLTPRSANQSTSSNGFSSGVSVNEAEVYFNLTAAIPVMIAVMAFVAVINMIFFISMTLNLSIIRKLLSDLYEDRKP